MKLFNHFSIYTVRVSNLKSFCQYVDVEFKNLLSHSITRWLSLLPALERMLDMFEPLKPYFLSLDNAPTILTKFFQNSMTLIYLSFLLSQMSLFQSAILEMEQKSNSIGETSSILSELESKLCYRKENCFVNKKTKNLTQIQFMKRKERFSFTMLATITQKVLTISKSRLRMSLNSPL